jgi:hypothetical protein
MPQIPAYSLEETEEAQLNKVKRAMNNLNTINAQHLTDKPLSDPTQGKADDYLTTITREIQDVNSAVGTLTDALYLDRELITFETFKVDNVGAVKENFKRTIKGSSSIVLTIKTITRQLDELRPNFQFVTLSTYTDFKTAFEELSNSLEAFTKVSTEIIEFLANNGLMNTKGYELFQTEKMLVQKVPGKKGKTKLIPSGDMNDPEFKPKITDAVVQAKIDELKKKDNYDQRFNNPRSKEYIDPNDQSDEARIKRDSLETYYLNTALVETGVGDVLEPSKYETEYDITEGRSDMDAARRLKTITILNDKIKLVSDPVAKQLKAIISSFMDLQNTYFGLVTNFNEARQQSITPAQKDAVSGGNYYGAGNYLSHPSAREMAAYRRSGLPEYI